MSITCLTSVLEHPEASSFPFLLSAFFFPLNFFLGDGERGGKEMKDAYFYIQHDPLNPYKLTVDLPDRSEGVVALLTK